MKLRVKLKNRLNASWDDYLMDVSSIFKKADEKRDVLDLWLHVVSHATALAEAVRRDESDSVVNELGEVTVWMLSFVVKLREPSMKSDQIFKLQNKSLTKMIWNKYPAICPACFDRIVESRLSGVLNLDIPINQMTEQVRREIPTGLWEDLWMRSCVCLTDPSVEERNQEISPIIRKRKDIIRIEYAKAIARHKGMITKLGEMSEMFQTIYGIKIVRGESTASVAFHLLEEIGEIACALIGVYTYNVGVDDEPEEEVIRERVVKVEEEVADVFSWIFGLAIKMRERFNIYASRIRKVHRIDLNFPESTNIGDIIWARYGGRVTLQCRICGQAPCLAEDECSWLNLRSKFNTFQ